MSQAWDTATSLPAARGFPAAAALGDTLFAMGGYDAASGNDSAAVDAWGIQPADGQPADGWVGCRPLPPH